MRAINIYALTRFNNIANLQRCEKQMSKRKYMLNIKKWEIDGLRRLVENLENVYSDADKLDFFYSFQMPKLGKEFDLLRISEDTIINIELKSEAIPDEGIRKQLLQNRYYLSYLGKNMRSYTYISKENRLVRLTNSEKLIDVEFDVLRDDLIRQQECVADDIEQFFKEEYYIISPLVDSERFLNKEYFLTSQQKDIEKKILARIKSDGHCIQGFTGLPGTGKTLLLYDIAMILSYRQRVCIFHGGSYSLALDNLDKRLKRIDFIQGQICDDIPQPGEYTAFLVDEAHLFTKEMLSCIIDEAKKQDIPVVLSYASEASISDVENKNKINVYLYSETGYTEHKLTNRIRANSELSSFIQCLMEGTRYNHRKDYPSVAVAYANDIVEAEKLVKAYSENGYTYICDANITTVSSNESSVDIEHATCMECENVVMLMDRHFMYDSANGLISNHTATEGNVSVVRNLFHGLNRAKVKIGLIIVDNEEVCDVVLSILQGKARDNK